ncbi:MAG: helix-turn-helix domain-containing protein [Bacteriovorax sp.]|nr:helix-turn-helix domain-containing protein [Bacteriovorax sp.]
MKLGAIEYSKLNPDFNVKKNLKEEDSTLYESQHSSLKTEYSEMLTSKEAADYLRVSVARLMNLTSNGNIPYYKFGRSNRYLLSELKEKLMSQPKGNRHGN